MTAIPSAQVRLWRRGLVLFVLLSFSLAPATFAHDSEQLARGLHHPASGKPALRAPGVFTNYAVGRARARAAAPVFSSYDLSTHVGLFLSDFGGHASSDDLYVVWIGANDLDDSLNALASDPSGATSTGIIGAAITAVAGNMQALQSAGATAVLIPNGPKRA